MTFVGVQVCNGSGDTLRAVLRGFPDTCMLFRVAVAAAECESRRRLPLLVCEICRVAQVAVCFQHPTPIALSWRTCGLSGVDGVSCPVRDCSASIIAPDTPLCGCGCNCTIEWCHFSTEAVARAHEELADAVFKRALGTADTRVLVRWCPDCRSAAVCASSTLLPRLLTRAGSVCAWAGHEPFGGATPDPCVAYIEYAAVAGLAATVHSAPTGLDFLSDVPSAAAMNFKCASSETLRVCFLQPPAPPAPPPRRRGPPLPPPPVPVLNDDGTLVAWSESTLSPVVTCDTRSGWALPAGVTSVTVAFCITARDEVTAAVDDITCGLQRADGVLLLGVSWRGGVIMSGVDDGRVFLSGSRGTGSSASSFEAKFVITALSIIAVQSRRIVGMCQLGTGTVAEQLNALAPCCQFRGAPGTVSLTVTASCATYSPCGRPGSNVLARAAATTTLLTSILLQLAPDTRWCQDFRFAHNEIEHVLRSMHLPARDSFVAQCVMHDVSVVFSSEALLRSNALVAALSAVLALAAASGSFTPALDGVLAAHLPALLAALRGSPAGSELHRAWLRCLASGLSWRSVCVAALGSVSDSNSAVWREAAVEALVATYGVDEVCACTTGSYRRARGG
jgi:hypothetical protein